MTPNEVVKSALNLSAYFLNSIKKESDAIVKYTGYEFPPAKGTPQNVKYFKNFDYKIKDIPTRAVLDHEEN